MRFVLLTLTLLFVAACVTDGQNPDLRNAVGCVHLRLICLSGDSVSDNTFDDIAHNNGVISRVCGYSCH